MGEIVEYKTEIKDCRKEYAESVVADMEAYANKHGLFLGKKEYVEHEKSTDCFGVVCRTEKRYLDAILFSGIVSAINGLEYVIVYNSYLPGFVFAMNRPDRRETYATGKGFIYPYPGKTKDSYDTLHGREFSNITDAKWKIGEDWPSFKNLVRHDWANHCPEQALDGMMQAFRDCEAKHVRRLKNQNSLEKKKERIQASEDALPTILDVLAPMVGGKEVFKGYKRSIYPGDKYTIRVDTELNTGVEQTRVECNIAYTPKRDTFLVQIRLYAWSECELLSVDGAYWDAEGDLETVAKYVKFGREVAGLYGETARKFAETKEKLH
jgi:hypothetical protein